MADTPPPRQADTSWQADTRPWQADTPPGRQTPPQGGSLQRIVRILLECILVLVTSVVQIHVFAYLHLLLVAHNLVQEFKSQPCSSLLTYKYICTEKSQFVFHITNPFTSRICDCDNVELKVTSYPQYSCHSQFNIVTNSLRRQNG